MAWSIREREFYLTAVADIITSVPGTPNSIYFGSFRRCKIFWIYILKLLPPPFHSPNRVLPLEELKNSPKFASWLPRPLLSWSVKISRDIPITLWRGQNWSHGSITLASSLPCRVVTRPGMSCRQWAGAMGQCEFDRIDGMACLLSLPRPVSSWIRVHATSRTYLCEPFKLPSE